MDFSVFSFFSLVSGFFLGNWNCMKTKSVQLRTWVHNLKWGSAVTIKSGCETHVRQTMNICTSISNWDKFADWWREGPNNKGGALNPGPIVGKRRLEIICSNSRKETPEFCINFLRSWWQFLVLILPLPWIDQKGDLNNKKEPTFEERLYAQQIKFSSSFCKDSNLFFIYRFPSSSGGWWWLKVTVTEHEEDKNLLRSMWRWALNFPRITIKVSKRDEMRWPRSDDDGTSEEAEEGRKSNETTQLLVNPSILVPFRRLLLVSPIPDIFIDPFLYGCPSSPLRPLPIHIPCPWIPVPCKYELLNGSNLFSPSSRCGIIFQGGRAMSLSLWDLAFSATRWAVAQQFAHSTNQYFNEPWIEILWKLIFSWGSKEGKRRENAQVETD